MREQLGELVTGLGRVEIGITESAERVRDMTTLVQAGMDRETQLFAVQIDAMTDRAARLQTGFDSDKETRLTILLAKIKRQEVLSDIEREEAFTLMRDEQSFNRTLTQMREQAKLELPGTQVVTVGGRKKLINTQTGEVISDLGASGAAGDGVDTPGTTYEVTDYGLPSSWQPIG